MINDILYMANKYAIGLENVISRRNEWLDKHQLVIDRLKEIADFLNKNSTYKQPFYVDKSHAFNEAINGTCTEIPAITFRSGEMPMQVTFKNAAGDIKEYFEEGFKITISPTITGQIVILIFPHYSNLDEAPPPFQTMAVLNDPGQINNDMIDSVVLKGLESAHYTSFTGLADIKQENDKETQFPNHVNPIGFKRYETTEKVK